MKMFQTIDLQEIDQAGIQSLLTLVLAIERLAKTPEVKDQALVDAPVSDLWFTRRTQNCVQAENIRTLGDLLQWSELRLMKTPNLGRKSLAKIKSILTERGLLLQTVDMNPQIQAELEDARKSVEVTQEMIEAGVEILSDWRCNADYVSVYQAVEEMYRAMAAIQAIKA